MKIGKLFVFVLLITFVFSAQMSFAATINIDFFSMLTNDDISDIEKNNIKDKLAIKEFKETEEFYYLLVSESSGNTGIAIVKIDKSNIENTQMFSVYNTDLFKNYFIRTFYVDEQDNIWFYLNKDSKGRLCKISKDGKVNFNDYDITDTINKFVKNKFYWYNSKLEEMFSWDGNKVNTMQIKNDIIDFTEHDNKILYTNLTGNVYSIDESEDKIVFNLFDYLKLDKKANETQHINLISVGNKLWITAGIISSSDIMIINTGLINITDNKVYNEVPVGNILKYHENGDDSIYFLMEPVFPPVSNIHNYSYITHELLIKGGKIVVNKNNIYFEEIRQNYIDKSSNIFAYNLLKDKSGLIKTAPDSTTINYYFKSKEGDELPVKVKCNNINITFDSNPYIENGRTMVPLRGLMYILGGTSNWNNGVVTLEARDKRIVLEIDSYIAHINGNPVKLDVCPKLINGRTMLPLRFILENFSVDLEWDDNKHEVLINKGLQF